MRRLILDHYRRWWFVLTPAAMLAIGVGWAAYYLNNYSFMFFVLIVAMWMGGVLLGRNLQQGLVRTVLALPLTARQIGRGWWFATVGIPAVAISVLLFLGATLWWHYHPLRSLPWLTLAGACLFSLFWLGNGFTCIYGMTNEIFGNWRDRLRLTLISALSMVMLFGSMIYSQRLLASPVYFAVFCSIGVIVTAASWLRAERFVLGRAGFRLTALQAGMPKLKHRAPTGTGGVTYLLQCTLTRGIIQIVSMTAIICGGMCFIGNIPRNLEVSFVPIIASVLALLLVVGNQAVPAVQQLRALRVLPISVTRLALTLVGIPILTITVVGALAGAAATLMSGLPAGLVVAKAFLMVLGPAALCIPIAVSLGFGAWAPIALYTLIFGCAASISFSYTRLLPSNIPPSTAMLAAVGCAAASLFFTHLALRRSSRPYRSQCVPVLPAGC